MPIPQRVLVLGAGGFIGRRVVEQLAQADWATPLAGVRRLPTSAVNGVEYRVVDATHEPGLEQALVGIDAVVNAVAGHVTAISVGAQVLAFAAARAALVPRIVHLSSMAVYGDATGVVAETTSGSGNLGAYGDAKVAAERSLSSYANRVILRPGCVYGPGSVQWSTRFAEWLLQRRLGDLGASGDGYCNLVHVDDVVEAIKSSLRMPQLASETFNLALPDPPTWNEYLIRYARALGAVPVKRISARRLKLEGKLFAPPLKIADLMLRRAGVRRWHLPSAMTPSTIRLMRQEIRLDVRRVQEACGLVWKPLDQGIVETARWYLDSAS